MVKVYSSPHGLAMAPLQSSVIIGASTSRMRRGRGVASLGCSFWTLVGVIDVDETNHDDELLGLEAFGAQGSRVER